MNLRIVVSPDFGRERGIDWILLSSLMRQRQFNAELVTPATVEQFDKMISDGEAEVVFANPVDALALVRGKGFVPFAKPTRIHDEILISCAASASIRTIMDLRVESRLALKADRCVEMVGMRLLEPACLDSLNTHFIYCETTEGAADLVITGSAEVAFFATDSYSALSLATRRSLRPLVKSDIGDLSHLLLCHPRLAGHVSVMQDAFVGLAAVDAEAASAMRVLGLELGFSSVTADAAEDMLDLVDALLDPSVGSIERL